MGNPKRRLTFIHDAIVAEPADVAILSGKGPSEEPFAAVACQDAVVKLGMTITANGTNGFPTTADA